MEDFPIAVYQVVYDLNKDGQDYKAITAQIESLGDSRKFQFSAWFLYTALDVRRVGERLRAVIDPNDRLFICRVTGENDGYLDQATWDWLNARLAATAVPPKPKPRLAFPRR